MITKKKQLELAVRQYRKARTELDKLRSEVLPEGSQVWVDCAQYTGPGKVRSYLYGCPVDELPVEVENGNVWRYPLIDCSPTKAKERAA